MPTTSALSQFTFTNYGRLTTTFTAPTSCQSEEKYAQITSIYSPHLGEWLADCSLTYGYCLPSGTITPASSGTNRPLAAFEVPYFSPGLDCPLDWRAVGTSWRTGERISTTGAFEAEAHTPYTDGRWMFSPRFCRRVRRRCCVVQDHLASAPHSSSMTGGKNGICYSTLPIYVLTTGCQ
ncbi:uncharacterized protein BO97DRAFT_429759 [Aspergillus homomorphus CBS 101889]|uniref:Uncharacterized protein n=1 Tax=Aspergillus homomorphus (strain CBS 101889) TaxID=1450537 RepID=A0A395HGA7_ASPHC|nr:hypothetical protein BO97DRAFT_429759 [Aspergillus homomorphus CBS 101889]RAL06961.1 hypothetical protein BO97DRAFT_429759 [Aspergillus homomorphus CBS 101889]